MKIFSKLETCANRFLVSENPQVPKISQFGEKNFSEIGPPSFKIIFPNFRPILQSSFGWFSNSSKRTFERANETPFYG